MNARRRVLLCCSIILVVLPILSSKTALSLSATYHPTISASLGLGICLPRSGDENTIFVFSAIYTDEEYKPPTFVKVIIAYYQNDDDKEEFDMVKKDLSCNNYLDGCTYEYSTTLPAGIHDFYFITSSGDGTTLLPNWGPNIVVEEITKKTGDSLITLSTTILMTLMIYSVFVKFYKRRNLKQKN